MDLSKNQNYLINFPYCINVCTVHNIRFTRIKIMLINYIIYFKTKY